MDLQARLDAFKSAFESGQAPYNATPTVVETMNRAIKELIQSDPACRALKATDFAPSFVLEDTEGQRVSSTTLLAEGLLIVSFYRGSWCPYCNMELEALQAAQPKFQRFGATLIAISPQTAVHSRKSMRQNRLTFPILSDPGNEVAAAFGLRFRLPDYLVKSYQELKIDLPLFNGDSNWTLPMPARYVIEADGTIVYSEVNPDYTRRPNPEELLPVLERTTNSLNA